MTKSEHILLTYYNEENIRGFRLYTPKTTITKEIHIALYNATSWRGLTR